MFNTSEAETKKFFQTLQIVLVDTVDRRLAVFCCILKANESTREFGRRGKNFERSYYTKILLGNIYFLPCSHNANYIHDEHTKNIYEGQKNAPLTKGT